MNGTREPEAAARAAGLAHVSDEEPGIRRVRRGSGFSYHEPSGDLVTDEETRTRIDALAIPPAWSEVWICPDPDGHIQATGRDDDGRKQYRYHEEWTEIRKRSKFHRMAAFGRTLPRIRRRVRRDLRRTGMPRAKVLALLVRLLDLTGIRIGTESARRNNGSYGLATLRRKHVAFRKGNATFRFMGKGQKVHELSLSDPRLASILQECHELPGYEIFQYVDDDGDRHPITASDVNDYIREAGGEDFTSRDFRTWVGSIHALGALGKLPREDEESGRRRNLGEVLDFVAGELRNTPAVCREFYVHPLLAQGYLDGRLLDLLERLDPDPVPELRKEEVRFLALLDRAGDDLD